ncbi:MAG: 16S rRNA (guanine(527)-N(7))-methyltransferase RsmG [Oscillospiraceae bacterium]|nr:16S rRNA (guanine(527)-N(7))-methyltransferase RsmG [Oscillospiraceae bacterium]
MEEILREGFAALGVPVTGEALAGLEKYYALLEEKNRVMNLTAIQGEEETARLHFLDCGALLRWLDPAGKRVLDLGSGAGFPGLVLKLLCPNMELTMLDSLQKRVAFQQEAADALGLAGVCPTAGRAEEMTDFRERFDIVTSRAVARLNVLAELALPMVRPGGVFAAMKGPDPEEEIREAKRALALLGGGAVRVEKYAVPGTDAVHSLVLIEKASPTPARYPRRFAQIKKSPL